MRAPTQQKKMYPPLPEVGTVYLIPLPNGLYSACRVLRHREAAEGRRSDDNMALVAVSAWVGAAEPNLDDPGLRETLVLTHHAFTNAPALLWVDGNVSEDFRAIGKLPPTEDELHAQCGGSGGWPWFRIEAYAEWRWEHEPEAMLREDAEKKAQREAARAEDVIQYREYLAKLTLKGMRRRRWFSNWGPYVPVALRMACRAIFTDTVESLIALGPNPSLRPRIRLLRNCIYRLNDLNEQDHSFIATVEREYLCEAFDEIVYACGLHACEHLADRWRDW